MAADIIARGMANSAQKKADKAYDLAAGRALALSVTNIQKLVSDFNTASNTYAKVGDNIYVQQLNVPDFWVFKVDTTRVDYTYTTDQAFLQAIARNGYVKVGYFQISQLESKHQVTFGYYYGNQFYYNAGHTDQIVPDENGMFFDIPTKDGYVYRDGAYTQIINSTEEAERKQADLDEAGARATADTALGERIDAEKTARENADAQLESDLATEAQTREAADGTLQANIDAEGATRASADETLTEALADEEIARQQADATLTTNLANEAIARQEADEAIIAKFTIPHDPETKVIGGKTYLFANGTPITITDGAGANNVTWYGKNSTFKAPNTMTIPYGSFVFGGGYNKDNGSYFESTFITIDGGSVERVFGGNLGAGNIGSATIIVNGGTITKGCHGGGQKGNDALLHSNSVGHACLVINGGNFGSVLSAGGVDVVSVGEVDMIINGGTMNYVYASGSNGTTGWSNVIVNGGTIQHALSVVRTSVEDVAWTINNGVINELWAGADDDAEDDGTIKHCTVNVLGGTVTALKLGYSGHIEGALAVEGTYVPGHIINEEIGVSECNLVLDAAYVEATTRAAEDAAIRTWAQQQITEKIDNSLYKIEFTIPATIWRRGIKGIRYLPKITFGDNISLDMERLLILRSNDPKFVEHEIRLVGQGNENGCGYILIDCDYYSKGSPTFPNEDIDCVLYVITLNTKNTIKTNGYVELEDEDWLNIDVQQIGDTVEINEVSVRLSGNELEVI